MRIRNALIVVTAFVVIALGADAFSQDTSRQALRLKLLLPPTPYEYARPDLPEHFSPRRLRRLDNTPRHNPLTDAGVTLGRVLFHDPLLSADGEVACASCHEQRRAFSDRRSRSRGVHGQRGRRNALSLVNLRYSPTDLYFWDERARSIEEQVLRPIEDPLEMAMPLEALPARIRLRPEYAGLFEDAFGEASITTERVALALAQFVRALVSYRSRYDVGLARVDDVAQAFPNFTKLENEGKTLFFQGGRGGNCASCHVVGAGRGGGFGRRGRGPRGLAGKPAILAGSFASNNGLDKRLEVRDGGVGEVTGEAEERGVFKAPSLRNVERTAPYMHDGRLKTLEAVIDHYNRKVEPHPNLDRRLRGRRGNDGPRRLNLSSRERKALVAFLKTLTDRAFLHDPRFSNPFR